MADLRALFCQANESPAGKANWACAKANLTKLWAEPKKCGAFPVGV